MLRRLALAALVAAVAGLLAVVPVGAAQAPSDPDCLRFVRGIDLQTATIPDLEAAMASGRLTSVDLVDAYEARIAAYDTAGPKLDAIRQLDPTARTQAERLDAERRAGHVRGPLHGIPVLLKDNIGTADLPTTAGSIALEGSVPAHDAFVTRRLRAAGAVILGKANLSEFAQWISLNNPNGYSSLGGQVINPYDLGDPSGSSSGSAVAAAMAFAGATLGTETSGSILSPSEVNSDVGVKTTVGLVSRAGIIPLAPDFDTPGPIVRDVTDAAIVLGAIAGPDPSDPKTAASDRHLPPGNDYTAALRPDALSGARIGYSQADIDGLDAQSAAVFTAALDTLRRQGATLVAIRTLDDSEDPATVGEIAAIPNEFKAALNAYLASETHPPSGVRTLSDIVAFNSRHPDRVKYGQDLLQVSDLTPGLTALGTAQSAPVIAAAQANIDEALAEGDVSAIVGPGFFAHGRVGAAAGYPTVIVPMGYRDGGHTPLGLAFLGTAFSEVRLLGYAYAYEQASHVRVPPTRANSAVRPASCAGVLGATSVRRPGARRHRSAHRRHHRHHPLHRRRVSARGTGPLL